MEFTVSRADLVRELNLLQAVAEKSTTIPVLSTVLIEALDDQIYLTASDLETSLRCPCAAKVKKSGSGAIPAKRLLDYARLLPDADIRVKVDEQYYANLTCGRAKARIMGMSRENFPALPARPDVSAEIPLAALTSMIGRTVFAVSRQESRFTLDGSLLINEGRLTMVATDGHRLAFVEGPTMEEATGRVLLPRKAMLQVLKLAGVEEVETMQFSHGGNHLFFRIGDRLLISREITGSFPDYTRVLPNKERQPHSLLVDREALRAATGRVSQFSDERSQMILVSISDGEVKLRSSTSDIGESEESVPAEYAGPAVEIGLNAEYLLDFLDATAEKRVRCLFKDDKGAFEMRGEKTEGYRYVVMPMRV